MMLDLFSCAVGIAFGVLLCIAAWALTLYGREQTASPTEDTREHTADGGRGVPPPSQSVWQLSKGAPKDGEARHER